MWTTVFLQVSRADIGVSGLIWGVIQILPCIILYLFNIGGKNYAAPAVSSTAKLLTNVHEMFYFDK